MGKRSNPDAFQGNLKKKLYFEGWYNKIVNKSGDRIYAIIPTIALNKREKTSHCSIQYFNAVNKTTEYFMYSIEDFENLSNNEYKVRIGKNYFSLEGIYLDIDQQGYRIKGNLEYSNPILWPKKLLHPGAMGWLSYIPFLEIYHGIVSMNHKIQGKISINGEIVNFENGKGYIEKDWGRSFPNAWIWTQSNHFSNPNLSFMFSIAKINFIGMRLNGFLSAIWYKGNFYKFATYTGAKLKSLKLNSDNVQIIVEDKKYRLDFEIAKSGIEFTSLKSPQNGIMSSHIEESINSKIKLRLFDKNKEITIIDDYGVNAGFEAKYPDILKPKK